MRQVYLLITCFISVSLFAQDFQGVATYKSHRKMNLKVNEIDENSEKHKQIQAQLAKQFQKEYTLIFNREESIYKENESLEKPMPNASGFIITVNDGSDILYKNINEKRYANATEVFGKLFLIKDSLQNKNWEFVNETKNIGEYTCNKAVLRETYKTQTVTDGGTIETVEKERETIAWYTMEIPVNNGPSNYDGLPGLILEINEGELTLICSKIVMNPKEKNEIKEPKKGKIVSQEKFDEIMVKKSKEMMSRFNTRDRKGTSETIIIQG